MLVAVDYKPRGWLLRPLAEKLVAPCSCRRAPRSPRLPEVLSFFFNDPATTEIYTLSLHDALPISRAFEPRRHVARALFCLHAAVAHVLLLPHSRRPRSLLQTLRESDRRASTPRLHRRRDSARGEPLGHQRKSGRPHSPTRREGHGLSGDAHDLRPPHKPSVPRREPDALRPGAPARALFGRLARGHTRDEARGHAQVPRRQLPPREHGRGRVLPQRDVARRCSAPPRRNPEPA